MTPPEHFLYGLTGANCLYAGASLRFKVRGSYLACLVLAGFLAVLPDIDAFFGSYGSRDPQVGHRGWTHSFLAVAAVSIVSTLCAYRICRLIQRQIAPHYGILLLASSLAGGLSHLLCDLITPPSVWGGLPLLFPSAVRFGGWSCIGWYFLTLFWTVFAAFLLSFGSSLLARRLAATRHTSVTKLVWASSFIISLSSLAYAVYAVLHSHYTTEAAWYSEQMKAIRALPAPIPGVTYTAMEHFLRAFNAFRTH